MKKRISIFLITILAIVAIFGPFNVFAGETANASISGGGTVTKGENVTVTVTISGHTFGSADLRFKYNTDILQYVKSSDGPPTASGVFNQSKENEMGVSSLTFTATFKAIGVGNGAIDVSVLSCSDIEFNLLDVSSLSTTVKVTNPEPTVSSNANLSSLYVSAGSLSPGFSAGRTSYTVYVDNDETVCLISAEPQDSDATIDVTGSKNLIIGRNVRSVIVTAPSGKTKTYTITIYREDGESSSNEKDDPNKPEDEDEKDVVEEITTTIGKEEYIIQEDIKSEDVPEDFRLVVGKYEGKDIPLIKDNDLKYTLALLKHKESGDLKWFFYDEAKSKFSKTKTFSPEEVMDYVKLSATEVEENNGYFDQNAILLLSVLGGTLVLLVLVVIVLQVKIMGKKKSSKKAKKNAKQEE